MILILTRFEADPTVVRLSRVLRAAGADDFLQKPFTVDKLLDRSCDLLELEKPVLA